MKQTRVLLSCAIGARPECAHRGVVGASLGAGRWLRQLRQMVEHHSQRGDLVRVAETPVREWS